MAKFLFFALVLVASTQAANITQSNDLKQRWKAVYDGCGTTKGCFGMPNANCVEEFNVDDAAPKTCEIIVTWEVKEGKNVYQLSGRTGSTTNDGYIALGLSTDNQMGSDSVIGCVKYGNNVNVRRFYNIAGAKANVPHVPDNYALTPTGAANFEGNLFCSFEQTNHEITLANININFANEYFLLLARTPSYTNGGALPYHTNAADRIPSPRAVKVTDKIIVGGSNGGTTQRTTSTTGSAWVAHLNLGLMLICLMMYFMK